MNWSLRARGLFTFLALIAYVIVVGLVLSGERKELLRLALSLEELHDRESALTKASYAIDHSLLRLQRLLFANDPGGSFGDDLALDVELIQSGLQGLNTHFPEFEDDIAQLGREILDLRWTPSRGGLLALQEIEVALDTRLLELDGLVRERHKTLWDSYYRVNDRMTLVATAMILIGATISSILIARFFTRLTGDLRKLGSRAVDIVAGYRGAPLPMTRKDEIGELMEAVNQMQLALRQREQNLELSLERHFHREKMAAIGSLAAAVAHEINNPIAAIVGIAQSMRDAEGEESARDKAANRGGAQLVLEQAQRISAISRQIAEFTRPRDLAPELLDLNGLAANICKFIGYDQRLRFINVILVLDEKLPAVSAVADHLTQALMNLLINSADALEGITDRQPKIVVATRLAAGEVLLTVSDNGHGMDASTLARAFEESFSTKPAEKGRGLGLFLCKTLLERDKGRIGIESSPGAGTRVEIRLPL